MDRPILHEENVLSNGQNWLRNSFITLGTFLSSTPWSLYTKSATRNAAQGRLWAMWEEEGSGGRSSLLMADMTLKFYKTWYPQIWVCSATSWHGCPLLVILFVTPFLISSS